MASTQVVTQAKPVLKWAGGKTQLLDTLLPKMPDTYNRYIEPFIGGGALFFAAAPQNALIADSNPELINLYKEIATNVENVISYLRGYINTEDCFYDVRSQRWDYLPNAEAAARMIFLNKTCFNGLYRVNRKGQFNVPFGKYKNPKICDTENLLLAAEILKNTTISLGDFETILLSNTTPGDFVFLDPPYVPVGLYSDFKRYTKEQFGVEDQVRLAQVVSTLHDIGATVVLTNSNHPLVHELYGKYDIEIHNTRRHINSKADRRVGQDVVVTIHPER